jgi:hypothetical protein
VGVAQARTPKHGRERQHKDEKEDASNFKPQNAAHSLKRAQESRHAAANATRRSYGSLAGRLPSRPFFSRQVDGGRLRRNARRRRADRALDAPSNALPDDASRDPQADADSTSDGPWSHSDYDGSSDALTFLEIGVQVHFSSSVSRRGAAALERNGMATGISKGGFGDRLLPRKADSQLPGNGVRIKVKASHAASRAEYTRWPPLPEAT